MVAHQVHAILPQLRLVLKYAQENNVAPSPDVIVAPAHRNVSATQLQDSVSLVALQQSPRHHQVGRTGILDATIGGWGSVFPSLQVHCTATKFQRHGSQWDGQVGKYPCGMVVRQSMLIPAVVYQEPMKLFRCLPVSALELVIF